MSESGVETRLPEMCYDKDCPLEHFTEACFKIGQEPVMRFHLELSGASQKK